MKVKILKEDKVFSLLVRERVNGQCEATGEFPEILDCAHIMSRRNVGLRWHPLNAIALARREHMHFTQHPFDWRDFCIEMFGEHRIAELRRVASEVVKWTPKQREAIYKHMLAERKKMQQKRSQGVSGRIEFEAHELMHDFESPCRM